MMETDLLGLISDPIEILKLCSTLHDRSGLEMQKKINKYIQNQTGATDVVLVALLPDSQEAVIQMIGDRQLEEEIRLPSDPDMFLSHTQDLSDMDFKKASQLGTKSFKYVVASLFDTIPKTFLVHPVKNPNTQEIQLLVCIANYCKKKCENRHRKVIDECFMYCFGTLMNTLSFEEQKRLKCQSQSLLACARSLLSEMGDLTDLLKVVIIEAKTLTGAERCSLFLYEEYNDDLVAKIFDGDFGDVVRVKPSQGIAGYVYRTGEVLNVRNVYEHPLFYDGVDQFTGFVTRNILCFPIQNEEKIIGVAQLCNKRNKFSFNIFDEEVAMAFSIFAGIAILHSQVYESIKEANARSKLATEMMAFYMKLQAPPDQIVSLLQSTQTFNPNVTYGWCYSPRVLSDEEIPVFILRMFEESGLIERFQIDKTSLARLILVAKMGYRDIPYHNWHHAVSVMHFAYLLLHKLRLWQREYLTAPEALALLISSLCHDVDHRGTTNTFQLIAHSPLAELYEAGGSVLERHHFAQTLCILNNDDCNILQNLTPEEYARVIDLIKTMILATDLWKHFKVMEDIGSLLKTGLDFNKPAEKNLLISIIMVASDLCDQTKEWPITRYVALQLFKEFFHQGDMEREMGKNPAETMDRDKADIPAAQVSFLTSVIAPLYEVLCQIFPETSPLLSSIRKNILSWQSIAQIVNGKYGQECIDLIAGLPDTDGADEYPCKSICLCKK